MHDPTTTKDQDSRHRALVREAVTEGSVTFRVSNVNQPEARTKEVPIGTDGGHFVTTLVGRNYVEVSTKELFKPNNRALLENERMVEIPAGESTLDIDIPLKTPSAP